MRVFTLAAELVSVGLLLVHLPSVYSLPELRELIDERDVSGEDAVELPNYDLYGGPPPNRGGYDYVTITYGGYGPPPPPPSSSVVSFLSSALNQSIIGTATSPVSSSPFSGTAVSVPSGALSLACRWENSYLTLIQVSLCLASLP